MSCSVQSGEVLLAWAKGMCPVPDSVFFARVGPWSHAFVHGVALKIRFLFILGRVRPGVGGPAPSGSGGQEEGGPPQVLSL